MSAANAAVPPGLRVYAFGDVHGRADLLEILDVSIRNDIDERPIGHAVVIGLGDYVDRGDHSNRVVDMLATDFAAGCELVTLKGNHEAMLLSFLDRPVETGPKWIPMGGWECVRSYGLNLPWQPETAEEWNLIRNDLARRLPPEHIGFLQKLRLSETIGDYFFVHAGARFGIPLDRQQERDLLWIRGGFADRDVPFEKVVVHGHTIVHEPFVGQHRINLDTGAYATGRLTCMVFEADERGLLEIHA
ncbi:MAG: serine/threonine protein phosphatase [Bauldia sp.]|nr:serine/threonine protein phosphatase [Bauldia sp.]